MISVLRKVEELRLTTGKTLAQAYRQVCRSRFSEASLTQAWLRVLQEQGNFFPDGWYAPPPHGIIAVFGKQEDGFAKVNQPSFRPESEWPRADRYYDPEDIILIYASPIDKESKLIGDFGLNLYSGPNKEIREHFENVLRATLHIADQAKAGMAFKELYEFAIELGTQHGFQNNIESSADKAGTNIGHTIPLSFESDPTHKKAKEAEGYEEIKEAIRLGRTFVNGSESKLIENDIAFTVEPRFSTTSMPNTMFHMTVIFENGHKRICHGFKPVMEESGMDYLMRLLP